MENKRRIVLSCTVLTVAVLVIGALFIVPTYREAAATRTRTANLQHKIAGLSGQTDEVQRLAVQVDQTRQRVLDQCRTIPDSPDTAYWMRALSLPVDGRLVLDQTITTGKASIAVADADDERARVMPLTIEITGHFDAVFDVLARAESMPRLVRLASLRISTQAPQTAGDRDAEVDANDPSPVVSASIGLEAVFEPGSEEG